MPKGSNKKRSVNWQASAFKIMRMISLFGPMVAAPALDQSLAPREKVVDSVMRISGYNINERQYYWDIHLASWTPYIITRLMTEGVPKLFGLLRSFKLG